MIARFLYSNITKLAIQAIIILCFMKFRFKQNITTDIPYSEDIIENLLNKFQPEELSPSSTIPAPIKQQIKYKKSIDFCTTDYFNLANENKMKLEQIIKIYGIGTCGPPGFYGTLDLHVKLENMISFLFNKPLCVLYSNQFTCINSTITCFVSKADTIFFHSEANEEVLRGIYASKAQSIKFTNLKNLEKLLKKYAAGRYYVYVSDSILGKYINLKKLKKLKEVYKFHLFIDVCQTFPMNLYEFRNYEIGDFIIGGFSVLSSCGAFVCGPSFQRLMSPSLCFSASLPAFLAANAIINLQRFLLFSSSKLKYFQHSLQTLFKEKNVNYLIFSSDLPFFFIQKRNLREYKTEYYKLLKLKEELLSFNFLVQIRRNPIPRILVCLKEHIEKKVVVEFVFLLVDLLNK
ncbi:Long chain base biosynthesis protein 1a [Cucumispora dikerogammari]|nr:Long chain base biosynthesis protein 1a [Cucumispora dikerogammari]